MLLLNLPFFVGLPLYRCFLSVFLPGQPFLRCCLLLLSGLTRKAFPSPLQLVADTHFAFPLWWSAANGWKITTDSVTIP
jgi:hypothetical protein